MICAGVSARAAAVGARTEGGIAAGTGRSLVLQSAMTGAVQSDIVPRYFMAFFLAHPALSHAFSTVL